MLQLNPAYTNRLRLINALRSGEHKKICYTLGHWEDPNKPVCFKGLAYRLAGMTWKQYTDIRTSWIGYDKWWRDNYNITNQQRNALVMANDNGASFHDLATMLENLP